MRSSLLPSNNQDEDVVDNSGMQNYVRLSRARPAESSIEIFQQQYGEMQIDDSLFDNIFSKGVAESQVEQAQNDERIIRKIIEKGRFVNKIAKALHEGKQTDDTKYEIRIQEVSQPQKAMFTPYEQQ